MTETRARPEALIDASRSDSPTKDTTAATSRSSPVITIVAASPLDDNSLDGDSIPCVIIEHVGPGSPAAVTSDPQGQSDGVHKCDDCSYSSHNKHYLKQHIDLVHNPERPYKCPFCDYAGKRSHSLREHLVVHTNERPFECEHCNASFRKKGHLTNHVKLHTTPKLIKCSLCLAYLINQDAFVRHLKEMHNTDKIYACEICDFVAGDHDTIMKHIKTHDKVFKCIECSFITGDINKLGSHADTHTGKAAAHPLPPQSQPQTMTADGPRQSPPATSMPQLEQSKQPVMIKCTECGFMDASPDTMKAHMWVHINPEATSQQKDDVVKPAERPAKVVQQIPTEISIIDGTLPENAAYKCTECSFIHKEATVFIKHMLSHRLKPAEKAEPENVPKQPQQLPLLQQHLQQSQPPQLHMPPQPPQLQQQPGERADQRFVVTPVTKENTCKNTEKTPFTHDQASGRFRCIICGYTCEYQRTIKAHIWKHSGNKAIDYPMFQNGPLSMYDDVPTPAVKFVPRTMEVLPDKVPEKSIPVAAHEEVGIAKPIGSFTVQKVSPDPEPLALTSTSNNTGSKIENTVTNIKLVKTDCFPKTLTGGTAICHVQTADGKTLALVRETVPKSPAAVSNTKLWKVAQLLTEPIDEVMKRDDLSRKPDALAESSNKELVVSDGKSHSSEDENIGTGNASKLSKSSPIAKKEAMLPQGSTSPPKIADELPSKDETSQGDNEMFFQVANSMCEKEAEVIQTEIISVVVETVETVPSSSGFTGMKSQQNSPRVQDPAQTDEWGEAGGLAERGSPQQAPAEAKSPSVFTRARTRQAARAEKDQSDERVKVMQAKQLALLAKEAAKDEADPDDTRGPLTRAKKHSEEALTLLSLLKKRPRVNPFKVEADDVKTDQDVDSETESENETAGDNSGDSSSKPKTGICSSLLAVIEQLRERSKSEGETQTDESHPAKNLPGKRQSRRRSRRESNEEDLSVGHVENMEVIDDDGEQKYRCKLCHYTNSKTLILRLHMRLHKSKKPFECSLCDFIAGSSESLQEHMIRHCKMRTYPCKLCPSNFNYKSQLRAHMRAHSDKDPLICHLCEFETNDPISYRNHLRFHADQYYHKCDICSRLFASKTELRTHKKESCYKDKPESIDSDTTTDSEYEIGSLNESFKCAQCDYTTSNVNYFNEHARIHEDSKTLKCELCDFTAVSSRSLKSHMKRHVNDQRYVQQPLEQYKCNLCGYVCHHLPSLKSHMWRHASDRNYSYEFTNDVINAAIDYDCRIDSSSTGDPEVLERVLISEKKILEGRLNNSLGPDGRQPVCWVVFKCCQCGFETINKAQLNVHMRSHSDIIQQTLEVTQGFARPIFGGKRPPSEPSVSKGDDPPHKLIKTQDHG